MRPAKFIIFFFLMIAILLLFGRLGYFDKFSKKISLNIATPIVNFVVKPIVYVKDIFRNVLNANALLYENYILRQQIVKYQLEYGYEKNLQAEVQRLNRLLNLKSEIPESVAANVISKNVRGLSKTIIIDVGTQHGISSNMPVLSSEGLVGKIAVCGLYYSEVVLATDPSFKASAYLMNSKVDGTCRGIGMDYLLLDLLPMNSEIKIGDKVVTSGLGSIFPRNYLIGTLIKVSETEHFKNAFVEPAVNFHALEDLVVLVIKKEQNINVDNLK